MMICHLIWFCVFIQGSFSAASSSGTAPYSGGYNPCENERGKGGTGRYYRFIAQNFARNVVRPQGEHRNIFCRCLTHYWMICMIYVKAGTPEERCVKSKLNRADPVGMQPFFVNRYVRIADPLVEQHPIVFAHPYCMPVVYAQIEVETFDGPGSENSSGPQIGEAEMQALSRGYSSPAIMDRPTPMLPISQCTQRTCPITLERIRSGQDVLILRRSSIAVANGDKVPCISGEGLRQQVRAAEGKSFQDPLRREDGQLLTIHDDYMRYIVFDDWDNPVCPRTPGDATPSDRLSSEGLAEGSGSSTPRLMSAAGSRDTSSNPSQASSSSTNRTPPDGQPFPTDAMRRMSITVPGSETPPSPPERRDSPPRFESNLPFIAGSPSEEAGSSSNVASASDLTGSNLELAPAPSRVDTPPSSPRPPDRTNTPPTQVATSFDSNSFHSYLFLVCFFFFIFTRIVQQTCKQKTEDIYIEFVDEIQVPPT